MIRVQATATQEPASCKSSVVLIGKNSRGNWVAKERTGLYGGLFVDRVSAVKYALFENGHDPASIIAVPTVLELEMGDAHATSDGGRLTSAPQRLVA